jgi:hypothetical protein
MKRQFTKCNATYKCNMLFSLLFLALNDPSDYKTHTSLFENEFSTTLLSPSKKQNGKNQEF